jgi:hypothetical protein
VELYRYSPYMPSWRAQGQIYLPQPSELKLINENENKSFISTIHRRCQKETPSVFVSNKEISVFVRRRDVRAITNIMEKILSTSVCRKLSRSRKICSAPIHFNDATVMSCNTTNSGNKKCNLTKSLGATV